MFQKLFCFPLFLSFSVFISFLLSCNSQGQEIPFIVNEPTFNKLNLDLFKFIEITLHQNKPASNLRCQVKVRAIQEVRTFSTGKKWVDLLEIEYLNDRDYDGISMKAYFPLGVAEVYRQNVTSQFSGTVEEIKIKVNDRLDHFFIFQHDGKGKIVWMMMGNSLMSNPCLLSE